MLAWLSAWSEVQTCMCPADVTATHFSKIQIGFSFLVPAHLGSPGKRAVKRVCDHEVFITQAPINNLTVMPFGTLV